MQRSDVINGRVDLILSNIPTISHNFRKMLDGSCIPGEGEHFQRICTQNQQT